jgi:hypothetical protein
MVFCQWQAAARAVRGYRNPDQRAGIMNDDGIRQQLEMLKVEHRDMDAAILALQDQMLPDQLQIARLKRKKLGLKDRIRALEDQLVPDIIA